MTNPGKLNLNTLLEFYKFPIPATKTVKLVFHTTREYDFLTDYRQGDLRKIETYQREQSWHVFNGCNHIISFIPDGPFRAVFTGIYQIDAHRTLDKPPKEFAKLFPTQTWRTGQSWYDMTRLDCMGELSGRLVVDWGRPARSWHQWLRMDPAKQIVEIRPRPSGLSPEFPGFDNLLISHSELQTVIADPDAYRAWHRILKSVGGVYLIVDSATGEQYVGSAYGVDGILGRWRTYAETGHGGNKKMKSIADPASLRFSILYTCSKSKSQKEVCHYETLYKTKLGSRSHGLNIN